uniref:Uncharacterized protein n=1 Tax=Fagus sylvatica TaxID=28930 RepID=A0A2N9HX49_FAGSY
MSGMGNCRIARRGQSPACFSRPTPKPGNWDPLPPLFRASLYFHGWGRGWWDPVLAMTLTPVLSACHRRLDRARHYPSLPGRLIAIFKHDPSLEGVIHGDLKSQESLRAITVTRILIAIAVWPTWVAVAVSETLRKVCLA